MLAYYSHGKGFRTTLVTATRGEGGQNEIGPELFESLAVLRTEELLAAHRFDGAEQYFTRAVDFGYSFSVEETLEKWGHQEILGRLRAHDSHDPPRRDRRLRSSTARAAASTTRPRRASRSRRSGRRRTRTSSPSRSRKACARGSRRSTTTRPGFGPGPGGRGGPGGSPSAGSGQAGRAPRVAQLPGDGAKTPLMFEGGAYYDAVLGRTCNEISAEARSITSARACRSCCRSPTAKPAAWAASRAYRLRDTVLPDGVDRAEKEPFDGVDTTLAGLAKFAGANPPAGLTSALTAITGSVAKARAELAAHGTAATVPPLALGLTALRTLRVNLAQHADRRQRALRDRLPARSRRKRSSPRRSPWRPTSSSTRWRTTASSWRASRCKVQMLAAIRGTVPVVVKARALNGFADAVGHRRHDSRRRAAHRRALQVRQGRGAVHPRSRRAVRPAVPAHAVHRHLHARHRRRRVPDDDPRAGAVGRQPVQRREARRNPRRARVCRDGDARRR